LGRPLPVAGVRGLALAVVLCALLPLVGLAQNAAESPPPKTPAKRQSSDKAKDTAPGSASKQSSSKDETAGAKRDQEAEKTAPPNVAESTTEPAPDGKAEDGGGTSDEKAQGAGAGGPKSEGAVGEPAAAGNVAEGGSPAQGGTGGATSPGPGAPASAQPPGEPLPPPPAPGQAANAAEGRPAGAGAGNLAENSGLQTNGEGVAEPPPPPFGLPAPAEVAGSTAGYTPPEMALSVPSLDQWPAPPPAETYTQPERGYLKERPLPAPDVTETDQERAARNIEESLKSLNLQLESRPAEGIKIPLPSGIVTFKAADAFQFDRRQRILTFTGNAEIIFSDVAVWADLIEINDSAATAYAKGYVAVQQQDDILYCDELYLNYDTKSVEMLNVEGNTGGPRLSGTLYFSASRAYGTLDRLTMQACEVTTCSPFCGSPKEAHLSAHKAVYKRNTSIVLHDVYFYAREHKVGYVPLLAFPLPRQRTYEQPQSEIQQNYGYDQFQGFFAKFAYTYWTRWAENVAQPLKGVVKLDLVQKLGPGLGVRQDILVPGMGVTTLTAFYQQDWPEAVATSVFGRKSANAGKNFKFTLDQELNFSREMTGSFLKINRTNIFVPNITIAGQGTRTNTWQSTFNLNFQRNKTQAALAGNQNINTQGGYLKPDGTREPLQQSTTTSGNFSFNRDLTKELKFGLTDAYSANKGGTNKQRLPADQEGNFQMQLNYTGATKTRAEGYGAKLTYRENGIDFDRDRNTTDNKVTINKDLPSLEVTLPRNLFNDGAYFNDFHVELGNLVTGQRRTPESIFRARVHAGGSDQLRFSHSSNLSTNASFDQYWYDDGNAQYAIRSGLTYSYDTYGWFRFDSGWNLNFHQGVRAPPVPTDRQSYSQYANYKFTFTNRRSWRWQLSGGYALDRDTLQSISSTFEWDPNRTFGLTQNFTLNYAINNVTGQTKKLKRFKLGPSAGLAGYIRSPYVDPLGFYNWQLRFSLDTDIERHFRTTRLDMRWYKRYDRGWSSEVSGNYVDGTDPPPALSTEFVRNFVKQIVVRKVSCCTTIEGGWQSELHQFYVNLYLNALPQYPGELDVGRYSYVQGGQTVYKYDPRGLFPSDSVRSDILLDLFGISALPFGGSPF